MKNDKIIAGILFAGLWFVGEACTSKSGAHEENGMAKVDYWLSRADQTVLLEKQSPGLLMNSPANNHPVITVDTAASMQTIEGFGFTLTGGSAMLINRMESSAKAALLNELFGSPDSGSGISYLRVSIGASDLSPFVFSYDDMPAGQEDPTLAHFSLAHDTVDLLPVLKQILQINPAIRIMGSPWSAPVWMKDNGSSIGGSLQPQYYSVYAQYFVKYIQGMSAQGITIDAITIQNEPQHGGNNPSMLMTAAQQATFIKDHLGPAFQAAGINTKIIIWDHNCDNPNYPISILNDTETRQFIHGTAFHLYNGDISALGMVHAAHPDKALYFTEQWTGANGTFDGDFQWHLKNVVIGSMRNWSRVALEWNLANDPSFDPHTPGGCSECKGAVTINGSAVTRNVGYYIVAQASRFIPPGSVRIGSNEVSGIHQVAFRRPDGKKVLLALNEANTPVSFNIKFNGKWAAATLPPASAATFTW